MHVAYRRPAGTREYFSPFLRRPACLSQQLISLSFLIKGGVTVNAVSLDANVDFFSDVLDSNACHNLISLPTRVVAATDSA